MRQKLGRRKQARSQTENRSQTRRFLGQAVEHLEGRRLLTVAAELIGDDLHVTGTPDGTIAIVSTEGESIDVFDDGELVFSFGNVGDDIFVQLDDSDDLADQSVEIDLGNADIDRIAIDMGEGVNRLILASGQTRGTVHFNGGELEDLVEVAEDFAVGGSMNLFLGGGDNSVELDGAVDRSLTLRSGGGNDFVSLSESSQVGGRATISMGDGENSFFLDGNIAGSVSLRSGDGDDLIQVGESAELENRVIAHLGSGANELAIDGILGSHLNVFAGEDEDLFTLGGTGSVGGNVRLRLGGGEDVILNEGEVSGRFIVDRSIEPPPAVMQAVMELVAKLRLKQSPDGFFELLGSGQMLDPISRT